MEQRPPVQVGEVVAGKYRVERLLGFGGMGCVVAARHLELDELRAIKLMHPEARANHQAEERFLREARAAAKLKSEHVTRVHDIGRLDDGAPFIVMEYLDGLDLKSLVARDGRPPASRAVDWMLQVCEALCEAHAAGIIHRDLKPSNLFVTTTNDGLPTMKVLDFGVSKLTGALAEASPMDLTHTAVMLGSPLYMSPEQMASTRDIDARADIWSLGVILYELCTGARPFRGKTITAVTVSVTTELPVPPRERVEGLPEELDTAVMRCLEKDPERRFGSVLELARALAPLASPDSHGLLGRIERLSRGTPPVASAARAPIPSAPAVDDESHAEEAATVASETRAMPPAPAVVAEAPRSTPPEAGASTAASWTETTGSRALGDRRRLLVAAVAAIVVVGGAAATYGLVWGGAGAAPTATAASPKAEAPVAAAPVDAATVAPSEPAGAAPSASPSTRADPAASARAAKPAASVAVRPTPTASQRTPPAEPPPKTSADPFGETWH
jgi:eukaryotic-like serine/threonine-protein kinase